MQTSQEKYNILIDRLADKDESYMNDMELSDSFSFLKHQLRSTNTDMITATRCLQLMLRIEPYRHAFVASDGIQSILVALTATGNFQLQYQLIFACWCLTFSPEIASRAPSLGLIKPLGLILSGSSKEKILRIILATFSNVLNKTEEKRIRREAALQMIHCGTLRMLELMDASKYDDPELAEDIVFVTKQLHLTVQDLSSFDDYCVEVQSGRLQWSPVHKCDQFWRENAQKFNEKNCELIQILIRLLEHNKDPLTLCVAAHDIGEYVRHCPEGKRVLEQYQGKQAVMRLLTTEDPNVRYHALLAVQKLMVHNWEYLGKQVYIN